MKITDVRGLPSDNFSLDALEVEGCAPDTDKIEVTVEVTGKKLSKTVSVRKDETWTARFKGTGKTDLSGFACGALVTAAAIASGDDTQRVTWKGCLPCGEHDESDADQEHESTRGDEERSDRSQEDTYASRRVTSRDRGEPLLVVEQHAGAEAGDALLTVRVAEPSEASYQVSQRHDEVEPSRRGEDWRDEQRRDLDAGVPVSSRHRERPDESRLAPHPDEQDHANGRQHDRRQRDQQYDEPRRRDERSPQQQQDQDRHERDRKEHPEDDEGTPVWLGGLLAVAEAGFLVSLAAEAYPLIVGGASALLLAVTAFFFANESPRGWAVWTLGGLGLAAIAIAAMFPFFDFVGMNVYLLASGIAAAGLGAGAAFLMFSSDAEGESESHDA